jgi:tetratricopeptide (TPR) repeat protein
LAETAADQILGAAQTEWLDRLADERANLEAALAWGLESPEAGAAEAGLRLAGALGWYWHFRGHWAEGRRWLAQVLARPEGDPEARARALCAAGLLAWAQDEYAEAEEKLRAGLDLLPAEPPTLARAHAAGILGLVLLYEENLAAAEPLFDRALQTFRALGDAFGVGISLIRLGIVARLQGNFTRAERVSTESLETYRALNNVWGIATASANLGEIALDQEDWQTAAGHYRRALAAMGPTGSQWYLALSLLGVAGVAVTRGAAGEAARLLGVVEAMVKSVEGRIPTMDRRMFERYRARAWAALGAAEFEAARAEGQAAAPAIWQGWVEAALRA